MWNTMNCLSSVPFWNVPRAPACSGKNNVHMNEDSTEHWWKDTDSGQPKWSEKPLFYCLIVHHKSHVDWRSGRTRASTVRGRRRITWAISRPVLWRAPKFYINLSFDSRRILNLFVVKTCHLLLCREIVAVYSDYVTKHNYPVWAECYILWALQLLQAFKMLITSLYPH